MRSDSTSSISAGGVHANVNVNANVNVAVPGNSVSVPLGRHGDGAWGAAAGSSSQSDALLFSHRYGR